MNKTSKIIIGIIIAVIIVGGIWYGVSKKPQAPVSKEPIKIGAIMPLTGNAAASIGVPHQRGLIMGIEAMKKEGINLDVVFDDDGGKKDTAVTIARQLLETDKNVKFLLSPLSGVSFALAPIAQEKNVVMLSTGANPEISKANENTFRFFINADQEAIMMAKYAAENLHLKSAAIFYINDAFGVSEKDAFKREFEKRNINVVAEESYDIGASDVKSQVTKIISKNPEAIIFSGYGADLTTAIKTVREFGFKGILLSDLNAAYPPLSTDLVYLTEGMYITDFKFDTNNPEIAKFVSDFKTRFDADRVYPNSALEYAAAQIIGQLIKKCGDNIDCIKRELSSSTFNSILGEVKFDSNRSAVVPVLLKHIVNGKEEIVAQ